MNPLIVSFDFPDLLRNVDTAFQIYAKEKSPLLAMLMANGSGAPTMTNTKYEWMESQLAPQAWTVNGAVAAAGSPKTVTFDSATGIEVGTIIRIVDGTTLAPVGDLQLICTGGITATDAVFDIYGGTTDIIIPDNAVARFMSNPRKENEKIFNGTNNWKPDWQYNYSQIFRETVELSDTAMKTLSYGNATTMTAQLAQAFYKLDQQIAEQVIWGRRVQRTGADNGSFAGIDFFINNPAGNVVDASTNAISPTLINNLIESIKKNGGSANTLVCNLNQARKISAFNTGMAPLQQITLDNTVAGSRVTRFVSDLPIANGMVNIFIDEKVGMDRIYLTDTSKIALIPYNGRGLTGVDASLAGQDGKTMLMRGEYSLQLKDAKYSHGMITNLQL